MTSSVLLEIRNRIAFVTLNRPDALNAQNAAMRRRINEILALIDADEQVLVGVIRGAGERAFSTGADIKEMAGGGLKCRRARRHLSAGEQAYDRGRARLLPG